VRTLPRRATTSATCALALVLAAVAPSTNAEAQPIHQVAAGESLWTVAAANGMTPAQLAAANGLSASSSVQAGQVLRIPPRTASAASTAAAAPTGSGSSTSAGTSTATTAPASTGASTGSGYVVQPGDTLSAIAARQGVSVAALAAANGIDPAGVLLSGRRLRAAGAGGASSSAPSLPTAPAAAAGNSPQSPGPAALPASGVRVSSDEIARIASENGVPASLARAIAWQESGFNNGAISTVGARGVMQVMPGTWDWIGRNLTSRPLDPSSATDNVRAGTLYLGHLLRQTGGDAGLAAAGYYQGLASVRRRGMYDDTKRYVENVTALRSRFGD